MALQEIDQKRGAIADEILVQTKETAIEGTQECQNIANRTLDNLRVASDTLMIGLFIAISISLVLSVIISSRITKPLIQLRDRLQDIAEGEGDLTKQIEVTSKDEVGAVAEWFNVFVEKNTLPD